MRRADRLALRLRVALLKITVPLARVAAEIVKGKVWFSCGFARADDFARERLGRSRRWLGDLAALDEAMNTLPGLEPASTGGDGGRPVGRVATLLIGRIACRSSTAAWVNLARRSTVRELRAAIARARDAGINSPVEDDSSGPGNGTGGGPAAVDGPSAVDHTVSADDPSARRLVRVEVPRAIRAAFDEAVDLFRAVEGKEATVTSFVEALVAENSAGSSGSVADDSSPGVGAPGAPLDTDSATLKAGPLSSVIETALARSTGHWSHLPDSAPFSPDLDLAEESLSSLEDLARRAGTGGPADLLDQMRALVSLENEIEVRLGRLLAGMAEDGAWTRLRFAGLGHYAEERLGLSRTTAEDRVRAGRALRRYPLLREAYERDQLGLEAALTVVRILNDAPSGILNDGAVAEEAWVVRAREATVKRLRDDARLLLRPTAPADGAERQSVDPEGPSPDPEGPSVQAQQSGPPHAGPRRPHLPPDDAEWQASLGRAPGTARRRILRFGLMAAGMGADAADPETALIPAPDVFLRLRLPDDLAGPFLAAIEAARRRLTAAADAIPWDAPWPEGADQSTALPSALAARTFSIRCRHVPAWVGLLALLEEFVLTWDTDMRGAAPANDRIYVRDGWRCTAPGCSSRRNLESHHVMYRSRLGGEGESNKTSLCRFHHQRGEHGGLASCSGEAPLNLVWRLGRHDLAEWYRNERRLRGQP